MKFTHHSLCDWFKKNQLGQYTWQQERAFFRASLQPKKDQRILLIGAMEHDVKYDLNLLRAVLQSDTFPADVLAHHHALPWRADCFDWVVSAHATDFETHLPQMLMEIQRITQPYGHLILTGFNPYSLWRLGRKTPPVARSYALSEIKKQCMATGWQIVEGRFMNYLPPVSSVGGLNAFHFMEHAGNRWWPHGAAVYGLVLRKHTFGVHLRPDSIRESIFDNGGSVALGLARLKRHISSKT